MKNITLKITGMHCSACEKITSEEIGELTGVSEIKVDAKTGLATLVLDEQKNSIAEVIEKVKKAGYPAEIFSENKNENAHLSHLHAIQINLQARTLLLVCKYVQQMPHHHKSPVDYYEYQCVTRSALLLS